MTKIQVTYPNSIFSPPQRCSGLRVIIWIRWHPLLKGDYSTDLVLRVELQPGPPIEAQVTQEASLVSAPAKHGQWHRDRDIDTNLSDVHLSLELPRGGSTLREDGSAVSVWVGVDDCEGVVESICFQTEENRAEDLGPKCEEFYVRLGSWDMQSSFAHL